MSGNLRGAVFMVLAMLLFALEDMAIKLMSGSWPVGQIVIGIGLGGIPIFALFCRQRGLALWGRDWLSGPIVLRNLFEGIGVFCFVTALAVVEISTISAILQAAPLVVVLGAAVFLGETVGWRRWAAILTGLFGVLLILRPGMAGFDSAALWAVGGMLGLAGRDIAMRRVNASVHSLQVAFYAFVMQIPVGLLLMAYHGTPFVPVSPASFGVVVILVAIAVAAYWTLVIGTRTGEVSFVTPFRYSRIVFGLIVGVVVFGEEPDALMLIGSVIVVGSGIYTLWRENAVKDRAT